MKHHVTSSRISNGIIRKSRIVSCIATLIKASLSIHSITSIEMHLPNRETRNNDNSRTNLIHQITQKDIQTIKKSENPLKLYNELLSNYNDSNNEDEVEKMFENEIDDAWNYAFQLQANIPFLACIKNNQNGLRRQISLEQTFSSQERITPVSNDNIQSCFTITLSSTQAKELSNNIFLPFREFSIIPYTSSMKMEYGLLEHVKGRSEDESVEFIIKVNSDIDDIIQVINEIGFKEHGRQLRSKKYKSIYSLLNNKHRSLHECDTSIKTKKLSSGDGFILTILNQSTSCTLVLITSLSFHPKVTSISVIPQFTTFNHVAKNILQGATNGPFTPFYTMGLNGQNQVVSVSDTGLDINNCYFYDESGEVVKNGVVDDSKRKVIQYKPVVKDGEFGFTPGYLEDDIGGHGTHVCGTIAGHMNRDGVINDDAEFNGIAPLAKIAFLDISIGGDLLNPPADAEDLFGPGSKAGGSIHVASWGAKGGLNMYSPFSAEYDKYLFENQDMVFVVAAGNFGLNGVSFPGTAKNGITVGASLNSYGPDRNKILGMSGGAIVEGNRKKPDILAPGSFIGSAYSGLSCDDVLWKEGTSMATPVIGGAIALIRQYFALYPHHNITTPSASLIKAILLNGAQPLYGAGTMPYDHRQNYGLVSLFHSLPTINTTLDTINALFYNLIPIKNEKVHEYNITVPDTCDKPLSATLVWHDTSTSPFILNDLDLLITSNGTNYHPNGLKNKDEYNNVERIQIQKPGDYSIKVKASNLVLEEIKYSLVVTGCFTNSSLIEDEIREDNNNASSVDDMLFRKAANNFTLLRQIHFP